MSCEQNLDTRPRFRCLSLSRKKTALLLRNLGWLFRDTRKILYNTIHNRDILQRWLSVINRNVYNAQVTVCLAQTGEEFMADIWMLLRA